MMAYLNWTKAMSVGVAALDADHRCLVRIIKLLENVDPLYIKETIETVLETLRLYSRFHFSREERVMRACGFPGFNFHRIEHDEFTNYVANVSNRVGRSVGVGAARELHDYLSDWLRHHILIQDMAYRPFIEDDPDMAELARVSAPLLDPAARDMFAG